MANKRILLAISLVMSFGLLTATTNSMGIFAQLNQTGQEINQSTSQLQTNVTALNNIINTTIDVVSKEDVKEIQQVISDVQQNIENRTDSVSP